MTFRSIHTKKQVGVWQMAAVICGAVPDNYTLSQKPSTTAGEMYSTICAGMVIIFVLVRRKSIHF